MVAGQYLWSMPREEYNRFGEDDCDFCKASGPVGTDRAFGEKVYTVTEHPQHQAERLAREKIQMREPTEIDYFGITRSFG